MLALHFCVSTRVHRRGSCFLVAGIRRRYEFPRVLGNSEQYSKIPIGLFVSYVVFLESVQDTSEEFGIFR